MTEAEAKAIEWRNGVGVPYRLLSEPMGGFISGTPRVATPADLAAAGYLPASRLLAAEAELASGLYVEEEMMQADNEQLADNGTAGAFSAHAGPGEDPNAPGDPDAARDLYSRFSALEADLEACDSWEKVNALRGLLGTRAQQSELTKTIQQRGEAGDITPTQRAELGKTWMRCNRKLEKLEATTKPPPVESSFVDEPETDAFSPERQPGEDDL